ncbi:hypothetical protein VP424E501_P0106 [Vibrio phage 424E50-1]|nr:hypothetical protein VP424E501_P0106 [Vibrio phage 424E50-1]
MQKLTIEQANELQTQCLLDVAENSKFKYRFGQALQNRLQYKYPDIGYETNGTELDAYYLTDEQALDILWNELTETGE